MYSYKNTKSLRKHTRIINTSICSHNRPHPLTLGVVHQLMCVVWWAVPFVALVENLKRSWLDCLVDNIIKITFLATENSRPWGKKKNSLQKNSHYFDAKALNPHKTLVAEGTFVAFFCQKIAQFPNILVIWHNTTP